jgi:hypothetical protein
MEQNPELWACEVKIERPPEPEPPSPEPTPELSKQDIYNGWSLSALRAYRQDSDRAAGNLVPGFVPTVMGPSRSRPPMMQEITPGGRCAPGGKYDPTWRWRNIEPHHQRGGGRARIRHRRRGSRLCHRCCKRLPFSWSTSAGFFIRERDLPVWRAVIGEPQEKPRWAAGL